MSTIRDLTVLVFNLTEREKKQFEQYVNRQGSDKIYMRVFRELERIIKPVKSVELIPDEEALLLRLRLEFRDGNVVAYCIYLFKQILRSLRTANDKERKEEEIQQDIYNAKILVRRGLFEAAIRSLEEALEQATLYEYNGLAIQALQDLVHLEGQKDMKSYADTIREKLARIMTLSQVRLMESTYFCIHYKTFLLTRSRRLVAHDEVGKELEILRQDPLLTGVDGEQSFFAQVYFWQAHASIANFSGEIDKALACSKEIITLWQSKKYEHMQEEHSRLYIIHLHNFVMYAISVQHFEEGEAYLNVMENFPCANADDAAEQFQNVLFNRQLLYLHTNRLREAIAAVTDKLKEIEGVYKFKINTSRLISLYYNTLVACFVLKDYPLAKDWSDRISKIKRTEQRRDIQFINKVFQIIIRFELGNFYRLEQEIKNTAQNLRDHSQLDQTNGIILHWLAKLVKNRQDKLIKPAEMQTVEAQLFRSFREELLLEKQNNANRQVIGLEEVLMWSLRVKSDEL